MSNKPVVNFTGYRFDPPKVGERAEITGISGHPNRELNGRDVTTSRVEKIMSLDEFETMNTIYKRI
jgi:hypothetical protein